MNKPLWASMKVFFLVVSVIVALSLIACSTTKSEIVGSWQTINGVKATLEFFSDNRVSLDIGGHTSMGNWSILDDGQIKVEITMMDMPFIYTGKIKSGFLQFEEHGYITKYEKIKK